jgi:hypothetical protein
MRGNFLMKIKTIGTLFKKNAWSKIFVSSFVVLWGLCGALTLLSLPGWMDQLVVHPHLLFLVVIAGLAGLCASLGYLLLVRLAFPSYLNLSKVSRIRWFTISFLVGALLVYLVPLSFPTYPSSHQLGIRLVGQNDLPSGTKQLYIEGLHQIENNFDRLVLTGFSLSGDWEKHPRFYDGTFEPLSTSSSTAVLSWQGEINNPIEVTLRAGPNSGQVQVTWDGQEQTVDLYSEIGRDYPINFSVISPSTKWLETILLLMASGVGFGFVLFSITTWLVSRPNPQISQAATRRGEWLLYALPCLLIGFIYLLTFWPGVMNIDSFIQWAQVLSGHYSDAHPVFHTFLIWFVTRVWLSPAMVAIVQIFAFSITAAWGFSLLRKLGLPNRTVWVLDILFVLFPPNGLMMVTLWKDIPYSICILCLTMMMLNILFVDRLWIKKWKNLILLAFISALVALFRHNGVFAAFGALFFLLLADKSNRRYLTVALIFSIAIWAGVRTALGLILQPARGYSIEAPLLHPVAAHLTAGSSLPVGALDFLRDLQPVDGYIPYICYSGERTAWSLPIATYQEPGNPLVDQPGRLTSILVSLSFQHPLVTLTHFICRSSVEWQINNSGYYETFNVFSLQSGEIAWLDEHANEYGIIGVSRLPWLVKPITVLIYAPYLLISSAIYRPAIYLIGLLIGISIAILRSKSRLYGLLAVPVLANSVSMVLTSRMGAFRYSYPTLLISLMLTVALMFFTKKSDRSETRVNCD